MVVSGPLHAPGELKVMDGTAGARPTTTRREPWSCAVTCRTLDEAHTAIALLNDAEIPVSIETCARSGPDDGASVETSRGPWAIVVPTTRVADARGMLVALRERRA